MKKKKYISPQYHIINMKTNNFCLTMSAKVHLKDPEFGGDFGGDDYSYSSYSDPIYTPNTRSSNDYEL